MGRTICFFDGRVKFGRNLDLPAIKCADSKLGTILISKFRSKTMICANKSLSQITNTGALAFCHS